MGWFFDVLYDVVGGVMYGEYYLSFYVDFCLLIFCLQYVLCGKDNGFVFGLLFVFGFVVFLECCFGCVVQVVGEGCIVWWVGSDKVVVIVCVFWMMIVWC